ncbi:hypothetical protein BD560DRAFT_333079 [Blakeslea trispora]|nr:hypothetical protein BD560DRAFT_343244 [Blakeslea trispora]KAI8364548.1 hypothetical protein BD560DRAFT_333079 [Blakeslea trispora]
MGKTPRLAFDIICLPRNLGGLGVINPCRHYLVLQMKWLFALFSTERSYTRDVLRHHFAILQNTDSLPLFSFFSSEHRPYSTVHQTSIVHTIYKAFDDFGINFALDKIPLSLLQRFSLNRIFIEIPQNHWLHRHPRLPVSSFLDFHQETNQLSIRRPGTYDRLPNLLFRLYREVVADHSIEFLPFVV